MRITDANLPSGGAIHLYDTVIHKKQKKWYRVIEVSEIGVNLKTTEFGEEICKRRKAVKFVPFDVLKKDYTIADFPPVKSYVDESLIEKASPEEQEKEKWAAKEAYAAKTLGIERVRRRRR